MSFGLQVDMEIGEGHEGTCGTCDARGTVYTVGRISDVPREQRLTGDHCQPCIKTAVEDRFWHIPDRATCARLSLPILPAMEG